MYLYVFPLGFYVPIFSIRFLLLCVLLEQDPWVIFRFFMKTMYISCQRVSVKVDFWDVFHTKMKKSRGRIPSTKNHIRKKRPSASCPKNHQFLSQNQWFVLLKQFHNAFLERHFHKQPMISHITFIQSALIIEWYIGIFLAMVSVA